MGSRVLIINDEVDLIEACSLVLQSAGYTVETLAHGKKAVQWVDRFDPDVVLLDWVLTETRGDIVFRELRSCYGPHRPRIVLMSALPELRRVALELSADGYLQKPFNDDQLVAAIAASLDRSPEMASR
jgi:DNA-binding response OmpR family regulator